MVYTPTPTVNAFGTNISPARIQTGAQGFVSNGAAIQYNIAYAFAFSSIANVVAQIDSLNPFVVFLFEQFGTTLVGFSVVVTTGVGGALAAGTTFTVHWIAIGD